MLSVTGLAGRCSAALLPDCAARSRGRRVGLSVQLHPDPGREWEQGYVGCGAGKCTDCSPQCAHRLSWWPSASPGGTGTSVDLEAGG